MFLNDTHNEDDEDDEDEYDRGWGMVDRMRLWRHDVMRNIYTRRRRSGETKSLVGRVRVPSTCPRNESDYIGYIDDKNDAS